MQARYSTRWLKDTGSALDHDGTNGWADVIAYGGFSFLPLLTLRWPNGIERQVHKGNLEFKGQAPKGWGSYDSSTEGN